jgi:hypothetical protein
VKSGLTAAAAAALALAAWSPAAAAVILDIGAGVIQPDENLLYTNNPAAGAIIDGVTNQTATSVSIFGGEILVGNGGQARVDAQDGLISSLFIFDGLAGQTLGFDLTDPAKAFTQAEFRIFVGRGTATQATITAYDTTGVQFQQSFTIPANGFFYANAIDGQTIDRFSIAANGSFQDVRQVRIGGFSTIGGGDGGGGGSGGVVPEPASWALMILGFGSAGATLRRRRAVLGGGLLSRAR